jgi:hypothetical protein
VDFMGTRNNVHIKYYKRAKIAVMTNKMKQKLFKAASTVLLFIPFLVSILLC